MVSLEYALNFFKSYFFNGISTFYNEISVYEMDDYLNNAEFRSFIEKTYDVSWIYIWNLISDQSGETREYEATKIYAAMNAFKDLPAEEQADFLVMDADGENSYYYLALSSFFETTMSEEAAEFANGILSLEMSYLGHVLSDYPTYIELLNELLTEVDADDEETKQYIQDYIDQYETLYAESIELLEDMLAEMSTAYSQLSPDAQAELTSIKSIYDYYVEEIQKLIEEYEDFVTPAP
jgi:archaellum component FlaC